MSTNEQYCGYIAKDKIILELEARIKLIGDVTPANSIHEQGIMKDCE